MSRESFIHRADDIDWYCELRGNGPGVVLVPLTDNFYVTTSGFFDDAALRFTIDTMGVDRVLFSSDYPYENMVTASHWLDKAPVSDSELLAISRSNAERLFKIIPPTAEPSPRGRPAQ